jgi:hypothetical protein
LVLQQVKRKPADLRLTYLGGPWLIRPGTDRGRAWLSRQYRWRPGFDPPIVAMDPLLLASAQYQRARGWNVELIINGRLRPFLRRKTVSRS